MVDGDTFTCTPLLAMLLALRIRLRCGTLLRVACRRLGPPFGSLRNPLHHLRQVVLGRQVARRLAVAVAPRPAHSESCEVGARKGHMG